MPESWPETSSALGDEEDDGALEDALRELAHAPPVDPEQLMSRLEPSRLAPGTRIDDAFVIERLLARGGMGVVYLARHELLQRPVAIKLCRRRPTRAQTERLLKEARAMAALGHPHVVAIHHVGMFDAQVYVAMEYVAGGTLRSWCARRPRRVDELLEAFAAAGRGLAAAHARGFVHRDFKPDNVLVGDDGRVRVGDFGLVSDGEASTPAQEGSDGEGSTRPGAGTPHYMAPEQRTGARVTAAADQYAFCRSLHEALEDAQRRSDRPLRVPRRVRAAIERGLRTDPAARHPSMDDLLRALEPRRHRWSRLAAAAVLASAIAASAVTWMAASPSARECPSGRARMAAVWSPERERSLRDAWTGDAEAHALLVHGLGNFATRWEEAFAQTCSEAELPTDALREASRGCLDEALAHFDETLRRLTEPVDDDTSRRPMEALYALPVPARCIDVAAMQRRLRAPRDAAQAERLAALRTELARIRAASSVSAPPLDTARSDAAIATARSLADRASLAAALFVRARIGAEANEAPDRTIVRLEEALVEAEAAGDDLMRAEIGSQLVYFIGVAAGRPTEALEWATRTQAVLARLGEAGIAEAGSLEDSIGRVHLAHGQLPAATEAMLRAASLKERALGRDHPSTASTRVALGRLLMRRGEHERARQALEAAQQGFQAALGAASPDVVHVRLALAELAEEQGRDDEALSILDDVLARWEAEHGSDHPRLILPLTDRGRVLSRLGRHDEAVESYARAREIAERALGPEDVQTGWALVNEASGRLAAGDPARALERASRAVELVHAQPRSIDALAAAAFTERAEALLALGAVEPALDDARRVLAGCAAQTCEPVVVARAGFAEARGLAALGRRDAARDRALRVLAELPAERRTARVLAHAMQRWLDAP